MAEGQGEIFHGRQIAAARALANMSIEDLKKAAGVTKRTVHRIETSGEVRVSVGRRHGYVSKDIWDRLIRALRDAGVELISEGDAHGAGARWTRRHDPLQQEKPREPDLSGEPSTSVE